MAKQELTTDTVERYIEASPEVLYDVVADVTRTPERTPDIVRCEWLDGATGPRVGAMFKGWNQDKFGPIPIKWSTKCTVKTAARGEEFAFIVPGADGARMQALGERIVTALRARALPHPASPTGHVTASVGLAAEVPSAARRPELLVQAADEALYAAKAAGRDRFQLA